MSWCQCPRIQTWWDYHCKWDLRSLWLNSLPELWLPVTVFYVIKHYVNFPDMYVFGIKLECQAKLIEQSKYLHICLEEVVKQWDRAPRHEIVEKPPLRSVRTSLSDEFQMIPLTNIWSFGVIYGNVFLLFCQHLLRLWCTYHCQSSCKSMTQ